MLHRDDIPNSITGALSSFCRSVYMHQLIPVFAPPYSGGSAFVRVCFHDNRVPVFRSR